MYSDRFDLDLKPNICCFSNIFFDVMTSAPGRRQSCFWGRDVCVCRIEEEGVLMIASAVAGSLHPHIYFRELFELSFRHM